MLGGADRSAFRSIHWAPGMWPRSYAAWPDRPSRYHRESSTATSPRCSASHSPDTIGPGNVTRSLTTAEPTSQSFSRPICAPPGADQTRETAASGRWRVSSVRATRPSATSAVDEAGGAGGVDRPCIDPAPATGDGASVERGHEAAAGLAVAALEPALAAAHAGGAVRWIGTTGRGPGARRQQRALVAARRGRTAQRRAEIHQRLVPRPAVAGDERGVGGAPAPPPPSAVGRRDGRRRERCSCRPPPRRPRTRTPGRRAPCTGRCPAAPATRPTSTAAGRRGARRRPVAARCRLRARRG